jgi:signal transduction histidine kinase
METSPVQRRLTERERVARELYDSLLQDLNGLILLLQAAAECIPPQEPARRMVENALACGDRLLLDGCDAHARLRVAGSAAADLPDALAAAGEELASDGFTRFRFELKGRRRPLQAVVDDETYRVASEAMRHAFGHARVREVVTLLSYGDAQLTLQVRDDGVAADHDPEDLPSPSGHAGASGMHESARRMGAHLSIRSAQGRGTQVRLTVAAALAYSGTGLDGATPRSR